MRVLVYLGMCVLYCSLFIKMMGYAIVAQQHQLQQQRQYVMYSNAICFGTDRYIYILLYEIFLDAEYIGNVDVFFCFKCHSFIRTVHLPSSCIYIHTQNGIFIWSESFPFLIDGQTGCV